MAKYFEIRWHGRGGQGTVTGAKSLAMAVQGTGKFVVAFPEYGPERRGAPIRAFNRFSSSHIRIHTPVQEPDLIIIVDPTLIGNPILTQGLRQDTIVIVNTEKNAQELKESLGLSIQKVFTVPANRISKSLLKQEIPNSAVMGAIARACPDIISVDKLIQESRHVFTEMLGKELVEKNLEAIKMGFQEGTQA
jgi:pyruvate ferredoxin oxidoreductase gamma subunit